MGPSVGPSVRIELKGWVCLREWASDVGGYCWGLYASAHPSVTVLWPRVTCQLRSPKPQNKDIFCLNIKFHRFYLIKPKAGGNPWWHLLFCRDNNDNNGVNQKYFAFRRCWNMIRRPGKDLNWMVARWVSFVELHFCATANTLELNILTFFGQQPQRADVL